MDNMDTVAAFHTPYCSPEAARLGAAAIASASPVIAQLAVTALSHRRSADDSCGRSLFADALGAARLLRTSLFAAGGAAGTPSASTSSSRRPSARLGRAPALLLAALCAAAVCYAYHVPLPAGATEQRLKLTAVDWLMRLFYRYPAAALHQLSASLSLLYTRHTLSLLMRLVDTGTRVLLPHMGARLDVTDVLLAGVPARLYAPPLAERRSNGSVVFIHGGGFAIGDVADYDYVVRSLAERLRMVVVSIDYRLSPEHPFPAGLADCTAATRHWLAEAAALHAVDAGSTVLVGDSAGGNLAAVVTHRLGNMAKPAPHPLKGQVLVYPLLQFADLRLPSYQTYYREYSGTAFLDPRSVAVMFMLYAGILPTDEMVDAVLSNRHTGGRLSVERRAALRHSALPYDARATVGEHYSDDEQQRTDVDEQLHSLLHAHVTHPEVSPLMAGRDELAEANTPPTGIVTAQYDILRDEGHLYAELLRSAGVRVHELHYAGGFHAMWNFHTELDIGHRSMDDVAELIHHFIQL